MEDVFGGGVAKATTLVGSVLVSVADVCSTVKQLAILSLFCRVGKWGAEGCKNLVEGNVGANVGLPSFNTCGYMWVLHTL